MKNMEKTKYIGNQNAFISDLDKATSLILFIISIFIAGILFWLDVEPILGGRTTIDFEHGQIISQLNGAGEGSFPIIGIPFALILLLILFFLNYHTYLLFRSNKQTYFELEKNKLTVYKDKEILEEVHDLKNAQIKLIKINLYSKKGKLSTIFTAIRMPKKEYIFRLDQKLQMESSAREFIKILKSLDFKETKKSNIPFIFQTTNYAK
ncbi:MAG: hypothetical protein Q7S92_06405 [Candidatus Diapherotrites archaeon]|nr:hypothetical protein [Candidatus Diapherotrites archaeon]